MSILHSVIPLEYIYLNEEQQMVQRGEMIYHNMLVEVQYDKQDIVLQRIIDGPLFNYLNEAYIPGTIIGKINYKQ